jgi:hypothetical protein
MYLVPENILSEECLKIILAMHNTKRFSSRAPNRYKPTKLHLQVQDYLYKIFNGSFMASFTGERVIENKFTVGYLAPIMGDWNKIEQSILGAIPTDRPMHNDMASFFWNTNTNISQFLFNVNIHAYAVPTVSPAEVKELKRRELPNDVSRCSEVMCPRAEACMRILSKGRGEYVVHSSFLFDEHGCKNFIGGM